MRILVITLLFTFALDVSASGSQKTYTSSNGVFRFKYSSILIDCMSPENSTSGPCMSQGGLCTGPGSEGDTMACIAYPNEKFKEKPSFVTAAFYVLSIPVAKTEKTCPAKAPNWYVLSEKARSTVINHIIFKTFEIGENWTSGGQDGPAYRTFHQGVCYELGIQNVFSRAEYDPGTVKQFTQKDALEVKTALREALKSFVFLR